MTAGGIATVAALTTPVLLRRIGCRVITINDNIDGTFPGRTSEPRPENLGPLSVAVQQERAAFGVAHDGDGDRAIFVDERGVVNSGDMSLTLVIGNKNYSSWSMRPWVALRAADIAFDEILIPLYTGDADKTLMWLHKAVEDRSFGITYLAVNPTFDDMRSDQRFVSLLKQMGLPIARPPQPPARVWSPSTSCSSKPTS